MTVANGIMGLAKCHADTLLVSAFDWLNFEWRENGWEDAYERAIAIREEIDAHLAKLAAEREAVDAARLKGEAYAGEPVLPFDQWWRLLRTESEYWDPPLPATGKQPPALGLKNFGAFNEEPMTRNDMKRAIGESEYEHFLANGALVDAIFFDMEPGTVAGPYRGPKGFYIVYLKGRTRPTNPLNLRTDKHRDAARGLAEEGFELQGADRVRDHRLRAHLARGPIASGPRGQVTGAAEAIRRRPAVSGPRLARAASAQDRRSVAPDGAPLPSSPMNRLGDLFRLLRPHARPHLGALVLIVVFGTASAMLQQGTFLLLLPTWEALFPEEKAGRAGGGGGHRRTVRRSCRRHGPGDARANRRGRADESGDAPPQA